MTERVLVMLLFSAGFWGILTQKNLIKKIFGLNIINSAVVLLFVLEGGRIGDNAPIMEEGLRAIVDPLPQALMLTAIVIGLCVNALALSLAYRLYRHCGSFDIDQIRRHIDDE